MNAGRRLTSGIRCRKIVPNRTPPPKQLAKDMSLCLCSQEYVLQGSTQNTVVRTGEVPGQYRVLVVLTHQLSTCHVQLATCNLHRHYRKPKIVAVARQKFSLELAGSGQAKSDLAETRRNSKPLSGLAEESAAKASRGGGSYIGICYAPHLPVRYSSALLNYIHMWSG